MATNSYKILKDIGRVKKYFTKVHLEKLVYAVISSRLDYCNSLYVNNGKGNLNKNQYWFKNPEEIAFGQQKLHQ